MKIILVLLDGLGDRSYKGLKDQTPLQAARTPHLDRLAQRGSNGLYHALVPGRCLPSETAHFHLFGYDPGRFPGRGLFEAVGYDVVFQDEDILSLAHLSSVRWEGGVPILAGGRKNIRGEEGELEELFASVKDYETGGVRFRLEQTGHNDAVLVMGGEVSPFISDSDPMVTGMSVARVLPVSGNPEPERSARTAGALNAYLSWCHRVLSDHGVNRAREKRGLPPANFLATQRCGRRVKLESFESKWGLSGMFIASGAVFRGLASELGFTFRQVKDGEDPQRDMEERIHMALTDTSHDFIHVHTKVPDEAAHRGDPGGKTAAIEALDQGLWELVRATETRKNLLVAVTSDHSTPTVSKLIHSGEPVPIVLAGPTVRRDAVDAFDEVSAANGCLGLLRGEELMLTLLNHADRAVLLGHRLGPYDRPYMADYEPFRPEGET